MKIVTIGAGNLSVHLSKALQNAGFEMVQVYSRTDTSAKELADVLQAPYTTDIGSIVNDASLYIISVCDDVIEFLCEKLPLTDGLVIHTAGSVPIDVFAGRFKKYGVMYPLQTFSKLRLVDFSEIPFLIEADTPDNLLTLRTVAEAVSRKVHAASSAERAKLHLAAVFGCNFVNHLYHISAQLANEAGFDFGALAPLILETAHKALASGNPVAVQTGPATRNDREVMRKQMEMLAERPEWREMYEAMSDRINLTNMSETNMNIK